MAKHVPTDKRRFYGRRQARPLSPARQTAIDTLLPKLKIPEEDITQQGTIIPSSLFEKQREEIWLEIGFGNGEHLAELTRQQPHNGFIGAEPFINGMAAFLKDISNDPADNIRVWMEDAIKLVDSIASDSLDGIYVLNPDPWHKTRHHKRRIISTENLDRFARILKSGATLIMTTDVDELAEWMLTHAVNHSEFEWTACSREDWAVAPQGWIKTRYEEKGAQAGRKQSYLIFKRR